MPDYFSLSSAPATLSNIIHLVHSVPEPLLASAKTIKQHVCAQTHAHTAAVMNFLISFWMFTKPRAVINLFHQAEATELLVNWGT